MPCALNENDTETYDIAYDESTGDKPLGHNNKCAFNHAVTCSDSLEYPDHPHPFKNDDKEAGNEREPRDKGHQYEDYNNIGIEQGEPVEIERGCVMYIFNSV